MDIDYRLETNVSSLRMEHCINSYHQVHFDRYSDKKERLLDLIYKNFYVLTERQLMAVDLWLNRLKFREIGSIMNFTGDTARLHVLCAERKLKKTLNPKLSKCAYCGKDFKQSGKNTRKFCSDDCAYSHDKKMAVIRKRGYRARGSKW